ncbi:protein-lysine N-methyltransferase EEF2KMT isoform X2 [Hemicordylus capensis]|uniref:protein-lysine N-methyltransferase EEF2KMT isoform X2 n=1 Tax=Hemicordylus capensis TaxID=884348 RepID=UPI00230302BE|nr:protein-lysine N-methyltransferase EEF2KMT isoform X2 [Hemicordylus capensis]
MEEPQQPAEEAEAAGGRLALRFQRAFLAGRRLAEFPWQDLEEILKDSGDPSSLLAILQKHESVGAEPLDELYEALRDVLTAEESTHCYKNYLLPSGDAITLCESVAIISRGTTGLVTWDAGLYLAEWAFENSEVFGNRNILELGSGIGLTGIAICKTSFPQAYTFSDHHQCVLQQLSENIRLNGFLLEPEAGCHGALEWKNQKVELAGVQAPNITVAELDWNCVTATQLSAFRADVVIAADVVYDPELTQSFIAVLRKLSTCKDNEKLPDVYIAFTIRNPDTYRHFQSELDKFGIRWQVVPGPQKNLFPYDRHATITILKLLV